MVYALSAREKLDVYSTLKYIRAVETSVADNYKLGRMRCPTHLSIGQELAPAVLSLYLNDDDYVVSTHRSHAHYLGKGGDLTAFLAELHGLPSGCSRGMGGSMHLADSRVGFMGSTAIVGNSIPVGVGLAKAAKTESKSRISVIFLGDGAVEEGVFYESINLAATMQLPALFVCENNGFSVYTDLKSRQPDGRSISEMTAKMGVQSFTFTGADVNELAGLLKRSISAIRDERGPALVEVATHRFLEHCGPNDDTHLGYRTEESVLDAMAQDPLVRLRADESLKVVDLDEIDASIEKKVRMAWSRIDKEWEENQP